MLIVYAITPKMEGIKLLDVETGMAGRSDRTVRPARVVRSELEVRFNQVDHPDNEPDRYHDPAQYVGLDPAGKAPAH
jgi:hypothetical protein